MYPVLMKHADGEIGLSANGRAAWDAGERPLFLWPVDERDGLESTIPHHVEFTARAVTKRLLVKFYRKPTDAPPALKPGGARSFKMKVRRKNYRENLVGP